MYFCCGGPADLAILPDLPTPPQSGFSHLPPTPGGAALVVAIGLHAGHWARADEARIRSGAERSDAARAAAAVCHRSFIVVDNFLGAEEVAAGVREGIQRLDHAGALRRGSQIQHDLRQDTLGDARTDCIGFLPPAVETHRPRQM